MEARNDDDLSRDRACLDLLNGLVQVGNDRIVVIGGYAVSARAMPRFSVDLDLVLHPTAVDGCRSYLIEQGLERNKNWDGRGVFKGKSEQWVLGKGRLRPTVDALVDGLHDRETGVSFSFQEIARRSALTTIRGFSVSPVVEALVPTREALIGLKLLPFRNTDIRDIFALSFPPIDATEVVRFMRKWSRAEIRRRAAEFRRRIEESGFRGSIKQTFALADDRAFDRRMGQARRFAVALDLAAQA